MVCAQGSSSFIEQGMVLKKQVGSFTIAPASLSTFEVLTFIAFVPIYDKIIVPSARRFTGNVRGFTELKRMGTGLILSILAMVSAALVETKRLQTAREMSLVHEKVEVPMSILWLVPQYMLIGLAEVFTSIGQIEFFYDQSPDAMRSVCTAFALVTVSLGSYLSSFVLTLVSYFTTRGGKPGWLPDNLNEGRLDLFFWLISVLSLLNFLVFMFCASRYRYKRAP
jgi:solute carrier family 15 (peptide/histidine transporter), member 3/4